MTRQISTKTPNQTVSQPATVRACRADMGTDSERAARAEEAVGQLESAQFHAKQSAETFGGRRTT
ncbi:hypothetical protein PV518_44730 [Streptomyces sp. ND04-05B]|uniref:hypothetical protein n=1 Tax=Streptomyces sp. ND04-05B TaxID=3028693 RepID=UPI0029BB5293|nr:hypothetical protein [Streptomyces sp. ND04-05B]MDX3069166.1 hypothetical protein [Streptomyces sp. ND04-05B]